MGPGVTETPVLEPNQKLRHLPFFEEVASHEEGDAAWRSATAGLVVLRLVDAWLEEGRSVVADDGWSVRSVRAAIESMDNGSPIGSILDRVVDALHEQRPDIHVVVTPLMAYAKALEYDAKWLLAEDVYQTVLAHLHPAEDSDASIAAHLRLGQCYRNLNRLDDALEAFTVAGDIAKSAGDLVGVLRARVGESRVAIIRGNLPRAEEILDDTIRQAHGPGFTDVRARALHERSNVAQLRGQYETAIKLAYEALEHMESATERDRILSDIALTFSELGVYSAARDAYLVLSATAREEYVRWAADLNLMDIATLTGAELLFESYKQRLARQQLPPSLATAYELHLGLGYHRFGNHDAAEFHLRKAVALAGEHGINRSLFEAEEALQKLEAPPAAARRDTDVPFELQNVVTEIKRMKVEAGID
jgi:tetratricopeptide (TPR) repeat protein